DAPPIRVCARDVPVPYSANLETAALPQIEDVVAAARSLVNKER
ncbi:MAG: alpha-ketoacid dehydrogenase subunit beta, partial [Chloroflexi bacterium]|nr:alpha-ketoacid dehydrogenase subunit beta [Chloroflexota bacterium]